jgi:hypothetical protein
MLKQGRFYKMAVSFPRYYNKNDFGMGVSATDVAMSSGKYIEIGSHQVGAKQEVAFGTGNTLNGVDTRKDATIKIYASTGQILNGTLRLVVADANLINQVPVQEDLLSNWSDGVAVEEKDVVAGEDGYLKIQCDSTDSSTIDFSLTTNQVDIPVVVTNLGV